MHGLTMTAATDTTTEGIAASESAEAAFIATNLHGREDVQGVEQKMETKAESRARARAPKLLRDFDRTANVVESFVIATYGADFADTLRTEVRYEYEQLIPQIPFVEGIVGGALNTFLTITAQELAVYKVMKRHGKTAEEAWEICHAALRLRLARYSSLKRWLLARLMFSRLALRRMRKRAESGTSLGFGDFEVRYVIGDGKEFDYGVDYVRCGNYKLMVDHGAEEFAPYVCMSDIALSETMGWGLIRTGTLADGCEKCNFRFKKGAKTQISSMTPAVQATIEEIAEKELSGEKWG